MDRRCACITVSLYLRSDGVSAEVHSYSGRPGSSERLSWLADAMRYLGGMTGDDTLVSFPCGTWHDRAARRIFLEASRVDPEKTLAARPTTVDDLRASQAVTVHSLGFGVYRVTAVAADPDAISRAPAVAAGFVKLADVQIDADDKSLFRFPCGASHDALVSLLLPRAINVRAALREQELAAGRGVLVAPSAQDASP